MNATAPHVSVIMTVLNEGRSLPTVISALLDQTHVPAEVVICDGGSTDNTMSSLRALQQSMEGTATRLTLLVAEGANISEGRNRAIEAATHDLIAVTDAGIRPEPDWLEQLVATFTAHAGDPSVQGVAGFFLPEVKGVLDTALAGTTQPLRRDVDPETFLPAGRSMLFTRQAWREAGRFPEWLDYCEDLVFDLRMEDLAADGVKGLPLAELSVVRVPPRESLRAFFKQYYLYARGDGKADLWRGRHAIRYGTYLVLIPLLLSLIGRGAWRRRLGWTGLAAGIAAYCRRPLARIMQLGQYRMTPLQLMAAMSMVPLIRVLGDVAKMTGYPVGWIWRIRNWKRPEIHWRTVIKLRNGRSVSENQAR